MRQIRYIPGKGKPKDNERVSAVFTVRDERTNSYRYVLRQACEKGLEAHGHGQDDVYFGFPGSNGYTGEVPEETAIRAAKQWGFDITPTTHFVAEDKKTGIVRHYVFSDCDNDTLVIPSDLTVTYLDSLTEEERYVIFLTPRELVNHDQVLDNAKHIVRFWDWKSL